MAKKQISNYKFVPGIVVPDTNLYPNATTLLELNKKFIQEETIAFIQYNVVNNISPYVYYTYNAEKCRRDISYIIEGYISDLRHGGNRQTVSNSSKYFENGVPQVDGDRLPEVAAHTFIKGLIQNFILDNIPFSYKQSIVPQVTNNAIVAETAGATKLSDLSDIVINVITNGLSSLPAIVSNRGSIKFPGFYKLKDILLITNATRNVIMFNFADPSLGADLTYSENFDSDFPAALYGVEKITTLTFDIDTSFMMVTDAIQIFAEGKEQIVRFNSIATDAMERQKVGIPQSMLDADFEYGLQPTKWQAIGLLRNYPSIYEIPGSDISVFNVTTDASTATSGSGSSLITVTTLTSHGLTIGTPFTIKALANSVTGFSRAEGSFLIADVPTSTTFNYFAKSKVGITNGQQLSSTYTQLRKGAFYTGSAVGNPSFSIYSAGSSGSITTSLITATGSDFIGFTGSPPPIGSPLNGAGITTGTQVTAVTGNGGVAASTTLTTAALIGSTTITVDSTAGISPGLVFDRGDGIAISVTDVTGNIVSLGSALTSAIVGSTASYSGLSQSSTNGSGTGAVFTVSRSGSSYLTSVNDPGNSYATNDTVTIVGTLLGGTTPVNNATITVTAASARNTVTAFNNASLAGGRGYTTSTSQATTGGGGTGLTVNITADASGIITNVAIQAAGSGYTASSTVLVTQTIGRVLDLGVTISQGTGYTTANNVATTGGGGTGLTVDITALTYGEVNSTMIKSGGTGYTDGIKTTTSPTGVVDGFDILSIVGGTGYSTATNVATTGGTGTGLRVNITVNGSGNVVDVQIAAAGTGYQVGNQITITGGGGNAKITVQAISNVTGSSLTLSIITTSGVITTATIVNGGSNYQVGDKVNVVGGTTAAVIEITGATNGSIQTIAINNPGTGYGPNQIIAITTGNANASFRVGNVSEQASISIDTVNLGGIIQSISTSGLPITAPTKNFISAFTLNAVTTSQIANGNTGINYGAISVIQVDFTSPHGFIPGATMTTQINSTGSNAQLAAGAYFVEQVPTSTSLRYTARATGAITNTLTGIVYARPDSFFLHRPFDGGVQLGTGGSAHGATAIRMSKKYIRYQSGKGVMYNTGALFAPSYDLRSLTSTATSVGSTITIATDDTDHGCQVGATITISGVTTSGYNGIYTVVDISDERTFSVIANQILGSTTAILGSPCSMSIRQWHGATVRAGIFDDQNGMFYQYDGRTLSVVRRSSTFQVAGVIAVAANSNAVTGTNTRFTQQLAAGDRIVVRGMSHIVTQIISDTSLSVAPDFRGVADVSNVKICKTVDIIIPQENWNNDQCNGSGPSGYNLDITRMQMIGIQHTWYGAGFIDFMLRGPDGNYIFVHRFRNSNVNTEAYMRTGNQPVRYEVINEGAKDALSTAVDSSQTTIPLVNSYFFPNAGTVIVDNELIRYTGNIGNTLTGCTRATNLTQFVAGSQRTFSGSDAATHTAGTGVILVSNTITPIISHWGSAFMIDGQFDSDRGYIFNYAATGVSASVEKVTAFLIRLAPSVSNAQTGDLGEKELLNRAQLLLSSIACVSDSVTGGGAIVVEGVLNPSNYPDDPTKITWTGLSSQAAGGQPSFAQIASGGSVTWGGGASTSTAIIQGAFTTTTTAKSFAPVTQTLTAISFSAVSQSVTAPAVSSAGNPTYQFAFNNTRTDFLIAQTAYAALTTPLVTNDVISVATYVTGGQRIVSVTPNYITISGILYARIVMTAVANATSATNTAIASVSITSSVAAIYNTAVSTARTDFLITQTQFASITSAATDVLSATTFITAGQTISTLTANYTTIAGVSYARIVMSAGASVTSGAGTGNNVTVTSTSAATARYGSALSTARTDFLITNASYTGSGLAVGDVVSIATYITGNQTISTITPSYITIGATTYTRIVMSAAANATSPSGASNDQIVTITAAGTSATYTGTNYLFFTSASWLASGAVSGTKVATDQTAFPAGTSVNGITTRTYGATTIYRINFTQSSNTSIAAAATLKFAFGSQYALPGEQVFSFVTNPGGTDSLSLDALKELTSTAIGGRGTFPNGPDVLAINVFKVSGTATPSNIILRWGEAQA